MPPPKVRIELPRIAVALGVTAWLIAASGCSSVQTYTASTLPMELRAPVVDNVQAVDISRFSGPPVGAETIDRGDILTISLAASLKSDDISEFPVRVGDDGVATLPEIGRIPLAGLHLLDAERQIESTCVQKQLYVQPQVTVRIKQQRANRVTVVGGVKKPGVYQIPRAASYLMAAIVSAEGFDTDAGANVEIRGPGGNRRLVSTEANAPGPAGIRLVGHTENVSPGQIQRVCLNLTEPNGEDREEVYLQDGSVVTVERRNPDPIQVVGLVNKPGRVELPANHELRVFGAIAEAGGLSSKLANRVIVLRSVPGEEDRVRILIGLLKAKHKPDENIRLAPGDVVSVEQTPATVAGDIFSAVIRVTFGSSMSFF